MSATSNLNTSVNEFCLAKIEGWEITSKNYFINHYLHPEWPGLGSGVTIGIGYDLGYESRAQFISDWQKLLSAKDFNQLLNVVGLKGEAAHKALQSVRDVVVDYDSSIAVFRNISMPSYEKQMLSIYPTANKLPANVYGMLLSLVYNRGTKLIDDKGSNRRMEMRALQPLVAKGDIIGIADQFKSMVRLWPKTSGLFDRYTESAAIIRACA